MDFRKTIPARLFYLVDVLESLDSLPNDELNEDVDSSELDAALRRRVSGLDPSQAEEAIQADRLELARWIDDHNQTSSASAAFVLGYLSLSGLSDRLFEPFLSNAEVKAVDISLPDEMNPVAQYGRIDASKNRVDITLIPLEEWQYETNLSNVKNYRPLDGMSSVVQEVSFGKVVGLRHMIHDDYSFSLHYVLSVPGGFVYVTLMSEHEFSADIIEPYLQTIRVDN